MTKHIEFSKLIILATMLTYFVGVGIGARVVLVYAPEQLGVYLAFIGGPTAVAIGFYAWKARAENLVKLGRPVDESGEMEANAPSIDTNSYHREGPYIEP